MVLARLRFGGALRADPVDRPGQRTGIRRAAKRRPRCARPSCPSPAPSTSGWRSAASRCARATSWPATPSCACRWTSGRKSSAAGCTPTVRRRCSTPRSISISAHLRQGGTRRPVARMGAQARSQRNAVPALHGRQCRPGRAADRLHPRLHLRQEARISRTPSTSRPVARGCSSMPRASSRSPRRDRHRHRAAPARAGRAGQAGGRRRQCHDRELLLHPAAAPEEPAGRGRRGAANRVDPDKLNELDRHWCSRRPSSRPSGCSRGCSSNTGCDRGQGSAAYAAVPRRAAPAHRAGRPARRWQDDAVRGRVEHGAAARRAGRHARVYRECTVQIGFDEASVVDLPASAPCTISKATT
jgi:hypothetical protein